MLSSSDGMILNRIDTTYPIVRNFVTYSFVLYVLFDYYVSKNWIPSESKKKMTSDSGKSLPGKTSTLTKDFMVEVS